MLKRSDGCLQGSYQTLVLFIDDNYILELKWLFHSYKVKGHMYDHLSKLCWANNQDMYYVIINLFVFYFQIHVVGFDVKYFDSFHHILYIQISTILYNFWEFRLSALQWSF